jgi:hypothetical protein
MKQMDFQKALLTEGVKIGHSADLYNFTSDGNSFFIRGQVTRCYLLETNMFIAYTD